MSCILVLIRHAQPAERQPGQRDFERGLTTSGKAQAKRLGEKLSMLSGKPQTIIASTAFRARETAELVSHEVGVPVNSDSRLYQANETVYAEIINDLTTASVAIVGHNPTISAVAAFLLNDSSVELHVGHAVVMEMSKWHFYPGAGRLVEYISAE